MPALKEITKDHIVKVAVKMVNDTGWDSINARSLAKKLGISTKPLYRIYNNMDEIKDDIYKEIYSQYDSFITSRIDSKKALITLCIAYVEFAQEYKNLFISLFLSNNLKWKSLDNVLDEKWNQSTIINLVNKHGYTFEEAKSLFMNIWLYANGLATLIATNEIKIDEKDILVKLVKMYKTLAKPEK
jgi:AcrR family transcriptional regulator